MNNIIKIEEEEKKRETIQRVNLVLKIPKMQPTWVGRVVLT